MSKEKGHIGKLYKDAFQHASLNSAQDDQDWAPISNRLDKKRFFRFSLTRFNIYYSSLIAISFLLLLFLLLKSARREQGEASYSTQSSDTSASLYQISSHHRSASGANPPVQENTGSIPAKTYPQKNVISQKSNTVLADANNLPPDYKKLENTITKDSSIKNAAEISSTYYKSDSLIVSNSVSVRKPKKIVYITRQDTIMVIDTLGPKKQRRKK
ncbi:MAG: hypothetical protein MUF42_00800 [Cytophagaceae bacterium]|jgi:hypothetical protein|nr:hypothetical protein [Cytophagaceae bacterium]